MGFINTLNHVTHGSLRLKIVGDHTRSNAIYNLIEMWDRYDPDTLMDLVDNDPDDNDCVMPKRFAEAYARYLMHSTMKLMPVRSYKYSNNDIFYNAELMYAFKTTSPTFLTLTREREKGGSLYAVY